jgi:hypothetical protein
VDGVDDVITRAGLAVLRIELDDPRLDHDPPRPEAPRGIPLPAGAIPGEGELGAPAAGVEPPASLPGRAADPAGVAARLADRGLDLLHEGPQAHVGRSGATARAAEVDTQVIWGIARHPEAICRMVSPSQAAPRAHRGAAHGNLRRRRNDGAAEASARKRCRSPGWNRKTIVLRWHHAHFAKCQFGAVACVRNSMCRQTLGGHVANRATANLSSLYLALLIQAYKASSPVSRFGSVPRVAEAGCS